MRCLMLFFIFFVSLQVGGQVRFAFLTDVHVVPSNPQEEALRQAVDEINADLFDFVVVTGDLTNMGSDVELVNVKSILDRLKHRYYVVPGNHETNWSESAGLMFDSLWGADRFVFDIDQYRFVGYNTGPYMKMGDGLVKNEDLYWLKHQLTQATQDGKVVVSMAHYPLDESISNFKELVCLLKQFDVTVAFCGHGHTLQKMNFNGINGVMGRALMDRQNHRGYNIVTLHNDSVFVSEKPIGFPEKPVFSFPFVSFHQVDNQLTVTDLAPKNMKRLFFHRDSCSVMGGAVFLDEYIVFTNSCGEVKCMNSYSGRQLWQYDTGAPIYANLFRSDDFVFVGTLSSGLIALDIRSGKVMWRIPSSTPVLAEAIVCGDELFIGLGADGLVCADVSTGRVKWSNNDMQSFLQAPPVLEDNKLVFGAWDTNLYCINRQDGRLLWKWNNGSPVRLLSPGNVVPAISDGKVFVVAPDRFLTVLNLNDGRLLKRTNQHQVRESMGILLDGNAVVFKTMRDSVVFLDVSSLHTQAVDCHFGYEHNPCPMVDAGVVVFGGTRQGVLFAVDGNSHQFLWSEKLGCSSVSKIVPLGQNRLLVTLLEGIVTVVEWGGGDVKH